MQQLTTRRFWADNGFLIGIALFKLLLHFVTNTNFLGYGFFVDEFYYWACSLRIDWGYVDIPPLVPFILNLSRHFLGDSMFAIRLLPVIAGVVVVLLAGIITRKLGGGKFAQCLAALAVTFAPVHLALNSFYSPNAFEVLFWTICFYVLIMILKDHKPRLWLWIGIIAGIGLLNKQTMLLFGITLIISLLLTPDRKYFLSKWLWFGGFAAILIFTPNIIWEFLHGWPTPDFYANVQLYHNVITLPLTVLFNQILVMNPLTFPIWAAGLYFFLFTNRGKSYRPLGWIYIILLLILLATQSSRPDRIAGSYPVLLAAGSVLIEQIGKRRVWIWLIRFLAIAIVLVGLALLPFSLPILPPRLTAQYLTTLGLSIRLEEGAQPPIPQYLSQRLGWQELTAKVADIYGQLPPNDRAVVTIITPYYAVAGAIEYYGGKYNLPRPISGHSNYYLWGYDDASNRIAIAVGEENGEWHKLFEQVTQVVTTECYYCSGKGLPIYIARNLKIPWSEAWPLLKRFQ